MHGGQLSQTTVVPSYCSYKACWVRINARSNVLSSAVDIVWVFLTLLTLQAGAAKPRRRKDVEIRVIVACAIGMAERLGISDE